MKSEICVDSSDFADFKITLPQSCPTLLRPAVAHKNAKVCATAGCNHYLCIFFGTNLLRCNSRNLQL